MSSFPPAYESCVHYPAGFVEHIRGDHMRKILFLTPLLIVYLAAPTTAAAADACPTFGGRATVVQTNVLGTLPTVLSDTGNIDSTGDAKQASLLSGAVAGLLTAEDLHATVVAGGTNSRA